MSYRAAPEFRQGLEFEALVARLLTTFVGVLVEEIDVAISDAQRRICELLGLQHSTVWQWTEDNPRQMAVTHLHRPLDKVQLDPAILDAETLYPWVLREVLVKRDVVLRSLADFPPAATLDRETADRLLHIKSGVVLPLAPGGGPVLGAVTFADLRRERDWSPATLGRLRLVAAILAAALDRKRAEAALRELSHSLIQTREEERSLLARELHDDVSQRLAMAAIDVGQVELSSLDAVARDRLRGVREALVSLSEDIHALSYQLHPSILDELGLAEAIEAECAQFQRHCSAEPTVHLTPLPRSASRDAALCLFRVGQEALHNVARHACARKVEVTLRPEDGGWTLTVHDDGVGFDPAVRSPRRSLGLESMRERVRLAGGRLTIESVPGLGTEVSAWVPAKEEPT